MVYRFLEPGIPATTMRRFLLNGDTLYPRFPFDTTPLVGRHLIARQGYALLGFGRAPVHQPGEDVGPPLS
jgi:hypothetical protein